MKKVFSKNIAFAIVSICILFSCNDDASLSYSEPTETNPHAIPMEQALASLRDFMDESNGSGTRAASDIRQVVNAYPVRFSKVATRTGDAAGIDCENLLYVANFEDNRGFAVLAADDRISEPVIALTDSGTLSRDIIEGAIGGVEMPRPVFEGYPLTGDGFFTVPEYPDEVFMNPNTVNLYDPDEDDTLVGNFSLGEDSVQTDSTAVMSGELVGGLCVEYAIRELNKGMALNDSLVGLSGPSRTVKVYSAWNTTKVPEVPILNLYKRWNQRAPFNDLYPEKHNFLFLGQSRKAYAGCVPLAMAKIMTEFEAPSIFQVANLVVNWSYLKNCRTYRGTYHPEAGNYHPFNSEKGAIAARFLLRGISEGCHSHYFYNGTFTFPGGARSFMIQMGYQNVEISNYKFSLVKEMIDKGLPTIIFAHPKNQIKESHAWNIDGYMSKERNVTTKEYQGNVLMGETVKRIACNMVHCDMGWGGIYNGYYITGVFQLNHSDAELDELYTNAIKTTNYNSYIKVLKYDLPTRQ